MGFLFWRGWRETKMRTSLYQSLRGIKNRRSWKSIVGYDWEDLKNHLEKKFTNGMSWKRFLKGEIHIDHIKPINSFSFSNFNDDFKRCWSLENLQPLWKIDNLKKGRKLDYA